jgi:serine/threonine protein kinase
MDKQVLNKIKYTEEVLLLKWLDQCSSALKYIHDRGKMHRDIKLLNIFLTSDYNVKLGDFGISISVEGTIQTSKCFGTELYNSPELNKYNKYNNKSDVW